mmetsp:Transcript_21795/g.49624  ORF Transcript_21795/g.49624 Transcript_21795/m.49624 type:complete len:166 (-) Transcript_21795:35-532(-)
MATVSTAVDAGEVKATSRTLATPATAEKMQPRLNAVEGVAKQDSQHEADRLAQENRVLQVENKVLRQAIGQARAVLARRLAAAKNDPDMQILQYEVEQLASKPQRVAPGGELASDTSPREVTPRMRDHRSRPLSATLVLSKPLTKKAVAALEVAARELEEQGSDS